MRTTAPTFVAAVKVTAETLHGTKQEFMSITIVDGKIAAESTTFEAAKLRRGNSCFTRCFR